jgi:hypothetical protein
MAKALDNVFNWSASFYVLGRFYTTRYFYLSIYLDVPYKLPIMNVGHGFLTLA